MSNKLENFKTLSYAAPKKWVDRLVSQLKEAGYEQKESGETVIEFELDGVDIFWAMESSVGTWLVRADKKLFTE